MRLKTPYPLLSLYVSLFLIFLYELAEQARADVSGRIIVEVVAIEYPPYTSEHLKDLGFAFEALNQAIEKEEKQGVVFEIQPHFLPPARANLTITQGSWAASFYPPLHPEPHYYLLKLDNKSVELGLFRLRVPKDQSKSVAVWPQLRDLSGRVAVGRQANPATLGLRTALQHTDMQMVPVDSLEQGFQLLIKGRVDFVFSEKLAGYLIADYLKIDHQELEFSDQPVFTTTIALWVNRQNQQGEMIYQALKNFQPALPE